MKQPRPFLKPALDEVTLSADWEKIKKDFEKVAASISALSKTTSATGTSLSSIHFGPPHAHPVYPFGTMLRYKGMLSGMEMTGMVVASPEACDYVLVQVISGEMIGTVQKAPIQYWRPIG